jgi:hypothetical protein
VDIKKLSDITKADLRGLMSPFTLRRRVRDRQIPYRVIANRIYLENAVIEDLLRGREVPADTPPARKVAAAGSVA